MQKTVRFRVFFTDYLQTLWIQPLAQSGEWQGKCETRRVTYGKVSWLLISPCHWKAIISMHFIVGTREGDRRRRMQFRFMARLLIDLAVHKLHTVSLRPLDLLPVYRHAKVTFSAAPGSAIWASWEASWKAFTNEVSYYIPSVLTLRCHEGFLFLLTWLVFMGSHWRIVFIV